VGLGEGIGDLAAFAAHEFVEALFSSPVSSRRMTPSHRERIA